MSVWSHIYSCGRTHNGLEYINTIGSVKKTSPSQNCLGTSRVNLWTFIAPPVRCIPEVHAIFMNLNTFSFYSFLKICNIGTLVKPHVCFLHWVFEKKYRLHILSVNSVNSLLLAKHMQPNYCNYLQLLQPDT